MDYAKFCAWLGASIEPAEAFYFRHDSQKNPQYDMNMKKRVNPILKTQEGLRAILTGDAQTFKKMFLSKVKTQYKSLKKAFYELDRHHNGHVTFEQFNEIVKSWGFEATDKVVMEVFNWLDFDRDQRINFLDLKNTLGLELMPQEQFFFRQDVAPAKKMTCRYSECWEDTQHNQKSPYCPLHQKIIRNLVIDLFERINQKISDSDWLAFKADLQRTNFILSIGKLQTLLL